MTTHSKKKPTSMSKILLPIFILVLLIFGGLHLVKSQLGRTQRANAPLELQIGSILPDFSLTQLDGTESSASKLKGKIFLINFWATWCEACMQEMPSIVKL